MKMAKTWQNGDRVEVNFPSGADEVQKLTGVVLRIQDPGPFPAYPERTIRVKFDDPLVFGGLGVAWVSPETLTMLS